MFKLFGAIFIIICTFMRCKQVAEAQDTSSSIKIIHILSEQLPCPDDRFQDCFQYYIGDEKENITVFHGKIKGYHIRPGYTYKVKANVTPSHKLKNGDYQEEVWDIKEVIREEEDPKSVIIPAKEEAFYYDHAAIIFDPTQDILHITKGNNIVLHYTFTEKQHKNRMDDGISESVYIEIEPDKTQILIDNPSTIKTFYKKSCFCPETGYRPIKKGNISIIKEGNMYKANISFPQQLSSRLDYTGKRTETEIFSHGWDKSITFKSAERPLAHALLGRASRLIGGTYKVVEINGQSFEASPLHNIPFITFEIKQEKMSGNNGCNQFSGEVIHLTLETIQFDKIVATRMSCSIEYDQEIMKTLDNTRTWKSADDILSLMDNKGNTILQLQRKAKK